VTGPSLATFVKAARSGLELLKRPQALTEAPASSTADRPDIRAALNDTGKAFLSWCDDKGLLHTLPGTLTSPQRTCFSFLGPARSLCVELGRCEENLGMDTIR
jgi:hypothetical protein